MREAAATTASLNRKGLELRISYFVCQNDNEALRDIYDRIWTKESITRRSEKAEDRPAATFQIDARVHTPAYAEICATPYLPGFA